MLETQVALFSRSLSEEIFGPIDPGPDIGRLIFFHGGLCRDAQTGELFDGEPIPGQIVGYIDRCPIIEITEGYLSLPSKSGYRLLNALAQVPRTIH